MEYASVRVGKLRLKGSAGAGLKGKKKRKRKRGEREEVREEDLRHGMCFISVSFDSLSRPKLQVVGGVCTHRKRWGEEYCF